MLSDWNQITEELQLHISRAALYQAADTIASQAEVLASEMESGSLSDQGGPNALRLLAAFVRLNGDTQVAGHA